MPYLTYDEYTEFGFAEIEQDEFDRLLKRASHAIDVITRHFYQYNDINQDIPWRREQFKKAVAAQIEYFYEMDATNTHGLREPTTVTIGRTTLAEGSVNSKNAPENNLISKDVYFYLAPTGLLYTGF